MEQMEKFRDFFDHSPDPVVITGITGQIMELNAPAQNRFHIQSPNVCDLCPGLPTNIMEVVAQRLNSGEKDINLEAGVNVDGHSQELELSVRLIDYRGQTGLIWVFRNISEKKRLEKDLRKMKERLELMFDAGGVSWWDWDIKNNRLYYDHRKTVMLGYTLEELDPSYEHFKEMVHPQDVDKVVTAMNDHLQDKTPVFELDYRMRHKDGHWVWFHDHGQVVERDVNGTPLRMAGTMFDISALKKSQVELQRTQERLEVVFDAAAASWWDWDYSNNKLTYDHRKGLMLGYGKGESDTSYENFQTQVHPEDLPRVISAVNDLLSGRSNLLECEYRMRHKDGHWVWFYDRGMVVARDDNGKPQRVAGAMFDITERRENREQLKATQEKFRAFFDTSKDPVMITDMDCRIWEVNPMLCQSCGYTQEELLGMNALELFSEEYPGPDTVGQWHLLEEGRLDMDTGLHHKDGRTIPVEVNARLIDYRGGKGIISLARDITERKMFEEQLRHNQEFLQNLVDSLPLAVHVCEQASGVIILWNNTSELFFSMNRASVVGHTYHDIFTPEHAQQTDVQNAEVRQNQLSLDLEEEFIDSITLGRRVLHTYKIPIFDADNRLGYILTISEDITEKKITDDALRSSEKQLFEANATKDRLFSIIAHDLRGPIGNVGAMLKMLLQGRFDQAEYNEVLEELVGTTDTTYLLLENLLTWARSQRGDVPYKPSEISLHETVDGVLQLLSVMARGKGIVMENKVAAELTAFADYNQLNTVVRNLVSNAIKFTKQGGMIKVTAKVNDDVLTLSIIDNGVGMTQENLEKLFRSDQHISTRGTNDEKGTGLGLIVCREFVEKNGGRIWVESEPGVGSAFRFTLPIHPHDLWNK